MLGLLQNTLTVVTLVITIPTGVHSLYKFVYLRFDDSSWLESHGKLLLEAAGSEIGNDEHIEMRTDIRLELERQQIAKLLVSRIHFPVWLPYLATFVAHRN